MNCVSSLSCVPPGLRNLLLMLLEFQLRQTLNKKTRTAKENREVSLIPPDFP